jgi:hypothetical protein
MQIIQKKEEHKKDIKPKKKPQRKMKMKRNNMERMTFQEHSL